MKITKENITPEIMLIKYNQAINIILDDILTAIIDLNHLEQINPNFEMELRKDLTYVKTMKLDFKKLMEGIE